MNTAPHLKIVIQGNVQVFNTMPEHSPALSYAYEDDVLGEIAKQRVEVTYNNNREYPNGKKAPDGIELRFGTARPTEEVRQMLRDHNYRFSEKQTMWYAIDKGKARELATWLESNDVDVDTTVYEKRSFWARVKSRHEYEKLRERTEFYVKTEPPKNFYSKSYLNRAFSVHDLIDNGQLYFKKYFNKVVGEDDPEGEPEESGAEDEPRDDEGPDEDEQQQEPAELPATARRQDSNVIADRLEALADGMEKEIESKLNSATSRQSPTAKRIRVAKGLADEGRVLLAIQKVLYVLALAHRDGKINDYPYLKSIRSKNDVQLLNDYTNATLRPMNEKNWQELFARKQVSLQKIGIDSLQAWKDAEFQKGSLLNVYHPSVYTGTRRENAVKIRELEHKVWQQNIPGFFPTPRPLIERMLQLADVQLHHTTLDPSAGKGDILDAVTELFPGKNPALYAVEINESLREILDLKGYMLLSRDFLTLEPKDGSFDRILMNPPFERAQDADHVTHALQFLRPGGRLVAIMVEGIFFRKTKKETAFRQLLRQKNAYVSERIEGAFNNAFVKANINVRIVAINQDNSPFAFPSADWQRSDDNENSDREPEDNTALLELEAEAELELLKLRVEQERRRRERGINGVTIDKLQRLRQKAWAMNSWQDADFK